MENYAVGKFGQCFPAHVLLQISMTYGFLSFCVGDMMLNIHQNLDVFKAMKINHLKNQWNLSEPEDSKN